MSLLVFGQSGQVARELQRLAPEATYLGRDAADLSDPAVCAAAIRAASPDAVINAAAYTAVDKAEEEEALALLINGDAPAAMAQACADVGVPLVHISTDYVFEGGGETPWSPSDAVSPQNAYGRTKLAGEDGVRAAGGPHAILRTSWVVSAHGNNFVKTMLRLSETMGALKIVNDQIGGPTPAAAIAAACLSMVEQLREDPGKSGTYHFSGAPDVSWADFAAGIFTRAARDVAIAGIPSADYPTPATRPLNSRLDCAETETVFGVSRPDWGAGLDAILQDLGVIQ
ncbi:dTDP-4-dehydrorhamnose reductase [Rhodobacteraceae bacterium (ex Bugula neritina AB1)]|nr:dTDP-4-dehydrorhamnose reductase [Rhodobacteraceae bacterium (ex Bugula neritina AB1)]